MSYWVDKVVCITGGSGGLGLHLARAFAQQQARLVLIGRSSERLEEARADLQLADDRCALITADLTASADRTRAMEQATTVFGRLDALINNAGKSSRGKILDLSAEELDDMMQLNLVAPLHCSQLCAHALSESRGHLVNIGSLASKVTGPHLGAYPATKFGLAAVTQQMRFELENVHVMLVCPGPIRREDAGERYNDQASELPDSARKPGGGVKIKGIDPVDLASRIVQGCEKRKLELVVPFKAKLLFAITALFPGLGESLLRRQFSS